MGTASTVCRVRRAREAKEGERIMAKIGKKSEKLKSFLESKVKPHLSTNEYDKLLMMVNELVSEAMMAAFIKGKESMGKTRRADNDITRSD